MSDAQPRIRGARTFWGIFLGFTLCLGWSFCQQTIEGIHLPGWLQVEDGKMLDAATANTSQSDVVIVVPYRPDPTNCFPERPHEITVENNTIELRTPGPSGCHVSFDEGLAPVRIDGKWGFINEEHRIVIPPMFDRVLRFRDGLAVMIQDEKYGYVDSSGKVAIPPNYDWAFWFQHGLASVKKDGKWGLIEREGQWVLEPTYEGGLDPTGDGFCGFRFSSAGREYLDKNGSVIPSPKTPLGGR